MRNIINIFNWKRKKGNTTETIPIKANKTNVNNFFVAIRNHKNDEVLSFIFSNPEFIGVVRFSPPQKDNGQTGLQVAFKVGNFEIAETLINKGADVNHISRNEDGWNLPVLHSCITATFWQTNTINTNLNDFEKAINLLELMLIKGSDANKIDSYGNSSLMRALLDAKQFIDHPDFNPNLRTIEQCRRVFQLLLKYGADESYSNENRPAIAQRIKDFGLEKYNFI